MSKIVARDFFDREIQFGDFFCFATRVGNRGVMNIGVVVDVDGGVRAFMATNTWGAGVDVNQRISRLGATERMVVVPEDSFPNEVIRALKEKANIL